jgi:chromate reductase, NAD(P)H dehydrogenase (quinone)
MSRESEAANVAATSGPSRPAIVLGLAGSLRRESYNRRLLEAALTLTPPGLVLVTSEQLAALPLFNEDLESTDGGPEAVRRLRREVGQADALLIATPEYNQSIPGPLKNAIDWLSRPGPDEVLEGKLVSVIGATAGPWGTRLAQAALRQTLYASGAQVLRGPALYVREAGRVFDAGGRLIDPSTRRSLEAVLLALGGAIGRSRQSTP